MDIIFQTKTDDPALALRDVARFDDGSGFTASLVVRSGWISAVHQFDFHHPEPFLGQLKNLYDTLSGDAVLQARWETHYLKLSGNGRGEIEVEGRLFQYDPPGQEVLFRFNTDQTVLPQLISDFETLASMS